jgi:hypothetical protein
VVALKFLTGVLLGSFIAGIINSRWIVKQDALRRRKIIIELPVAHTPDKSGQENGSYRYTRNQKNDNSTHKDGGFIITQKYSGGESCSMTCLRPGTDFNHSFKA